MYNRKKIYHWNNSFYSYSFCGYIFYSKIYSKYKGPDPGPSPSPNPGPDPSPSPPPDIGKCEIPDYKNIRPYPDTSKTDPVCLKYKDANKDDTRNINFFQK